MVLNQTDAAHAVILIVRLIEHDQCIASPLQQRLNLFARVADACRIVRVRQIDDLVFAALGQQLLEIGRERLAELE